MISINHQKALIGLTEDKASSAIKIFLENLPVTEKGQVFEWYLAELFKGNGWLTNMQGGRYDKGADILLYHPKTPSEVSLIVQAKNCAKPLSFDDTKIELIKFEERASAKYKCNQFEIISINGFVSNAIELKEFNMLLKGWDYVQNLINRYDPTNVVEPEIELYAHNEVAYCAVKKLWEKDKSVAVVQATGTGKSYIIAKIMTDFFAERTLVMAPSNYILKQQESKVPWALQSTTFMTYAKGVTLTHEDISQLNCKLIVLDEFHRCGAEIWGAGVQKILNTYPDAYVLGTSATPVRYLDNSRDMGDELFNSNIAENLSLAESIVRRILPTPTYISALYTLDEEAENILNALENSQKTEHEKKQLALEIQKARLDWEKTSGIPEILKKHLAYDINKLIIFCKNEEHLDEMEVEVPRWFQKAKIHKWRKVYRVLTADPASDKNLEDFKNNNDKNTVHLLFAIDMLNEGLHIDGVGAVILLRPTESPNIFYQQIGRCIQVDSIHTPIIFDFVNNFKSLKSNNFLKDLEKCNHIQNFKRASFGLSKRPLNVRIIDETKDIVAVFEIITEQIQPFEVGIEHMKSYIYENGHARVPRAYKTSSNFSLGVWASSRRGEYKNGTLSADKITALESLNCWIWDGVEAYFQEGIEELKKYVSKYGNARVTAKYKTEYGYALGTWVAARRREYKAQTISVERIKALESIYGWAWDLHEENFQTGIEKLKKYVDEYGHALVPRDYKTSSGFNLGPWVNQRRVQYAKGFLPVEKIKTLESLSGWVWDPEESYFQDAFNHLKQYVIEHGHAKVPRNYITSSRFNLGTWLNSRRLEYDRGVLRSDRMQKLEVITGWTFNPNNHDFKKGLKYLKRYVDEYGHARVSKKYITQSGFKLGQWVKRIQFAYLKMILSADKVKKIEAIDPYFWDPQESYFQEALKLLKEHVIEYGHARVPRGHITTNGFILGTWVEGRRKEYRKGVLSADRIGELEKLKGWAWDLYEDNFLEGIQQLKNYVNEFGHARVPRSYKTSSGYALGSWVNFKKIQYQSGDLQDEKVKFLEEIPGWISSYKK